MNRLVLVVLALATASMVAMFIGSFAHDDLGIALDTIRFGALDGAAGIFAAVAWGSMLARLKK
jgi:hypothetical protein